MQKTLVLLFSLLLIISQFSSCVSDCDNEKIGDIDPPERYYDFSVYDDNEVIEFENENGEIITFRADTIQMIHRLNIEENGETSDPVNGSFSCFKYMAVPSTLTQLVGTNGKNNLQIHILPTGETELDLEYEVQIEGGSNDSISNEFITSWASVRYNFTNDAFIPNESLLMYPAAILNEWRIHGKIFLNVMILPSQDVEVYFVEKIGFVGLRRVDGELYTLKQ